MLLKCMVSNDCDKILQAIVGMNQTDRYRRHFWFYRSYWRFCISISIFMNGSKKQQTKDVTLTLEHTHNTHPHNIYIYRNILSYHRTYLIWASITIIKFYRKNYCTTVFDFSFWFVPLFLEYLITFMLVSSKHSYASEFGK